MIRGQNDDVPHRGRVFHVQTEDSGRSHPHVTTHVFLGGTVLATERCDYADCVDAPDLPARVRRLIDEQHAAMVERLRRGELDAAIAERLAAPGASEPAAAARGASPPAAAREVQPAAPLRARAPRAFVDGPDSDKPLDEVILDYLIQRSRERAAAGRGRGSRSEG